jgi:hypothetical protein
LSEAQSREAVVRINDLALNFMLSVVKSIEPRDQLEAMLAAQMAATHNAVMTFARRLNHVENIPQQDSAERAYNKLARTYVAQVDALKRYRSAGQQTVRVEHVTVNEGGQAVVHRAEEQWCGGRLPVGQRFFATFRHRRLGRGGRSAAAVKLGFRPSQAISATIKIRPCAGGLP